MARTIHCVILGREAEGLDFQPYPGELGERIFAQVSKEASVVSIACSSEKFFGEVRLK